MKQYTPQDITYHLEYLSLLSNSFKNIAAATTELMNLKAILNLPKGTEHFITDIHGEYQAFEHVMRNGSGVVYRKIHDTFGNTISEKEATTLANLISYPKRSLARLKKEHADMAPVYEHLLNQLVQVCIDATSKYSRNKVNKALPKNFAYIINELLFRDEGFNKNRKSFYEQIIHSIIDLDLADDLIVEFSHLIQQFTIDHLHIIGDVYDRGPGPHFVMDRLINHHSIDIQWGNHDILWMGAAAGNSACIACAVRICLRYANTSILEDGYGINLLPLAALALKYYNEDPCTQFMPKVTTEIPDIDDELMAKMHKAISIIQFKLEGALIQRHPDYEMENRQLLEKIDFDHMTITIDDQTYPLNDTFFPTIDRSDPYALSCEEKKVVELLVQAFINSEKLQRHIRFMFSKGGMYLTYNDNLLFHACIPMNADGTFREITLDGKKLKGKQLLDEMDRKARAAYFDAEANCSDFLWYLWCHRDSPLFGKDQMTTFERYFIDDKAIHKEHSDPYFTRIDNFDVALYVLDEFGIISEEGHIINGHIPVKFKSGVSPIRAEGKVLVIDGGFSKAYQSKTGIAGFTLIYNSYGMVLVSHEPFESVEKVLEDGMTVRSTNHLVEEVPRRKLVADTDAGKALKNQIRKLEMLTYAYKNGLLKEKL
jgi:fructose-1,6-bisphosphatase-3